MENKLSTDRKGIINGNLKTKGTFTCSIFKAGSGQTYQTFYDYESAVTARDEYRKEGYESHVHKN